MMRTYIEAKFFEENSSIIHHSTGYGHLMTIYL